MECNSVICIFLENSDNDYRYHENIGIKKNKYKNNKMKLYDLNKKIKPKQILIIG